MELYLLYGLLACFAVCFTLAMIGDRYERRSGKISRLKLFCTQLNGILLFPLLLSAFSVFVVRVLKINAWFCVPFPLLLLAYFLFDFRKQPIVAFAFGRIDEIEMHIMDLKDTRRLQSVNAAPDSIVGKTDQSNSIRALEIIKALESKKDPRAIQPLETLLSDKNQAVRDAALRALKAIEAQNVVKPQQPEDLKGAAREVALAIKMWSHEQAKHWWEQNPDRVNDAICDVCNESIPEGEGYFLAGWMRCEKDINSPLCDTEWRTLLASGNAAEVIGNLRRRFDPQLPEKIVSPISKSLLT